MMLAHHATHPPEEDLASTGYWRHQKKDGTLVDVETFHSRTTFAGKEAEVVLVRDVTARRRAERHLAMQYEIARVFAECRTMEDAAARILGAICRSLGWQFGALWRVDPSAEVLRFLAAWRSGGGALADFENRCRDLTMSRGVGLPGRVWEDSRPLWFVPEMEAAGRMTRRGAAADAGLRVAFGVPIAFHGEVLGVMEFCSRSILAMDPSLLQTMVTVGVQIGHYLERLQAEHSSEMQRRLAQINAEVANALVVCDTLEASLQRCVEAVVRHLAAAFAGVWTLQQGERELALRASAGRDTHLAGIHARVPVGAYNIGRIAQERRPQLINCVGGEHSLMTEGPGNEAILAFAGYPLLVDDQVVGVLAMFSSQPLGQAAFDALGVAAQEIALGIERKTSEQELRSSGEFNRCIVEGTGDGILVLDTTGRLMYLSPAAQPLFEIPEAVSPLGVSWLDFWQGADRTRLEAAIGQAAAGHRASFEGSRSNAPGAVRRLEVSFNAIRDRTGAVDRLVAIVRDVTEGKQLEAQLAQAQKLESIGQLAAGIAHEINTPIQYVGDNARFLQDAFQELRPMIELDHVPEANRSDAEYFCEEIPKALEQLLEGVQHVGRIVRAMKEFSHPGAREKTAIDLNRAIQSTVVVSRNEWKYVAEMVEEYDSELPFVNCVPGEINQVILNLIVNAAHAIADVLPGQVADKGAITVSTRREGKWAEILVRDTGTGIPETVRTKIFDPFFTTKEVGKGTGQGLSIAHTVIVKNHGGTIHFETETGVGTAFVVRLPLSET